MKTQLRCLAVTVSFALAAPLALAQQPQPQQPATPPPTGQAQTPPAAGANARAPAPAVPPSWAQGRKGDQETSTLAPHPPGLSALPANELPVKDIKVPPGFTVSVYASGAPNARSMTFGRDGMLYVGTRFPGVVYAVSPQGEVKTLAKGLHRSNGVAYRNGDLYVAELSRVIKFANIDGNVENAKYEVVYDALPKDEAHGWKFMKLGPDGKLYFQIGAPGNIVMPPATHATVVRLDPDKKVLETMAYGVRNSVGMDFHPVTKELWFTNNGRDWINDDLPNDTLHRLTRKGQHFGYPFCHQGDQLDDEFGKGRTCEEFDKPAAKLGPHVAALGMRFYTGNQFPAEYRNNIFIAEHGSWNRTKKSGYNVSRVVLDAKGKVTKYEAFATGWLQGDKFWGRPADVQVAPDGSLLVSDDVAGAIFKISYRK
jgi:glucose/arabinose dehydrogenase